MPGERSTPRKALARRALTKERDPFPARSSPLPYLLGRPSGPTFWPCPPALASRFCLKVPGAEALRLPPPLPSPCSHPEPARLATCPLCERRPSSFSCCSWRDVDQRPPKAPGKNPQQLRTRSTPRSMRRSSPSGDPPSHRPEPLGRRIWWSTTFHPRVLPIPMPTGSSPA